MHPFEAWSLVRVAGSHGDRQSTDFISFWFILCFILIIHAYVYIYLFEA